MLGVQTKKAAAVGAGAPGRGSSARGCGKLRKNGKELGAVRAPLRTVKVRLDDARVDETDLC